MKIKRLTRDDIFASNCYVLFSSDNGVCIFDPSVPYAKAITEFPEMLKCKQRAVLLTHGHIDHIWELESYADAGFEIYISESDSAMLKDAYLNCSELLFMKRKTFNVKYKTFKEGDIISLGGLTVEAIATPGHTAGSVCYLCENALITGDTVFASGGFGRYDLPSGSRSQLEESIKKIFMLDGALVIYPGHGEICALNDTKLYF